MKVLSNKNLATAALWAASVSVTAFWVLNIFKEAYPGFKSLLNFYSPVGPLLGLFLASLVVFFLVKWLLLSMDKFTTKVNEKTTFWVYVVSVTLFFVMVFPPVFEPIVHWLAGK